MSDRYVALTVVLEQPRRDDDAAALIAAIQQMRGVLSVTPEVADVQTYAAYERARLDMREALWRALQETKPK